MLKWKFRRKNQSLFLSQKLKQIMEMKNKMPTLKKRIKIAAFVETLRTVRCGGHPSVITYAVWIAGKVGLNDILNVHYADNE